MAKKGKETESESAGEIVPVEPPVGEIVPADEPSAPPVEPSPAPPSPAGSMLGQRVRRILLFLLRLFLVLVILALLAVGLSYSLPMLYQTYIKPVQDNAAQVARLNTRIAQNETDITGLQTKLEVAQAELTRQAQSLSALETQVRKVDEQVAAHTRSLAALEQMQAALQEQNDAASAELARQVKLMKSMELLSRARLYMYQSNFGLARQDVQIARDMLAEVQPSAPEPLASDLAEVIQRLDLTLSNLPGFPVAASDDLDIAWQILLAGIPAPQPGAAESAIPTPIPLPEITSTPTPTETPTVEPTATP